MNISDEAVRKLLIYFQRHFEPGTLKVDGIWGEKSEAALLRANPLTPEEKEAAVLEPVPRDQMAEDFWHWLSQQVGKGGDGKANNEGAFIDFIRELSGVERAPHGGGEWCAVLISAAYAFVGFSPRSRGAHDIVNQTAQAGQLVKPSRANLYPGMIGVALFGRTGGKHVRAFKVVSSSMVEMIGGNEGREDRVNHHVWGMSRFLREAEKLATF